jgi:hypothetical protein
MTPTPEEIRDALAKKTAILAALGGTAEHHEAAHKVFDAAHALLRVMEGMPGERKIRSAWDYGVIEAAENSSWNAYRAKIRELIDG